MISSWGQYPPVTRQHVQPLYWRCAPLPKASSLLPYGQGRSYGDVCLNDGGTVIPTTYLNHFIRFDRTQGILRSESGVTLADILKLIVPAGWFLAITPGTKFVSVGGAIANDVHGKNHHRAGTFGHHVTRFELLRSSGERLTCSSNENSDLFRATIGGLGLTGLITWAEFKLKRVSSVFINSESIRVANIQEAIAILQSSQSTHEYAVASLDSTAPGKALGRGYVLRGNHATKLRPTTEHHFYREPLFTIPFNAPAGLMNRPLIALFNRLYYHRQLTHHAKKHMHYEPFFYPQDAIGYWNRLYGKHGFLQHQSHLPVATAAAAVRDILETTTKAGLASPITTLKLLGDIASPGILSFPRPGFTLALDVPNTGQPVYSLFEKLTTIVREAGGSIYPAKDARMSAEDFQAFYPHWQEFSRSIDPQFSSSLWRRVTNSNR